MTAEATKESKPPGVPPKGFNPKAADDSKLAVTIFPLILGLNSLDRTRKHAARLAA